MKVFVHIVFRFTGDDRYVEGVFSTEGKAEELCAELNAEREDDESNSFGIMSFELDKK